MDIFDINDLPFPQSLPEFQRLFPDENACAGYLERARWIGLNLYGAFSVKSFRTAFSVRLRGCFSDPT